METQIIIDGIKKFLVKQFPATKNIKNGDPLLKSGLIDSLGILEIVTFIEKEFDISIADDDLVPEHFQDVESIMNFIALKIGDRT